MGDTYIHYGCKEFDLNKFTEIRNLDVKPRGGFWASSASAKFGWKDWCKKENFRERSFDKAFCFKLKDWAKVLLIDDIACLETLPQIDTCFSAYKWVCLDFEKIAKEYDAIEFVLSNDGRLYWPLYGWDCDCILILNKDAIEGVSD